MAGSGYNGLAEQADALASYVDTLLCDLQPSGIEREAAVSAPTADPEPTPEPIPEPIPERVSEPAPTPEPVAPILETKVVKESAATQLEPPEEGDPVIAVVAGKPALPVTEPSGPGLPDWAAETFQVLMFMVNGLSLGVPLASLVSIVRWQGIETCAMPGQPAWQRGVLTHQGRLVSVVETALLVMPERAARREVGQEGYLLLVGDGSYGLLVDGISSTQAVRRNGVRWYNGKRRPWLAGTLVEQLSALLEVDRLLEMLDE
jgi:purine-binding chemotaxis protein CheW